MVEQRKKEEVPGLPNEGLRGPGGGAEAFDREGGGLPIEGGPFALPGGGRGGPPIPFERPIGGPRVTGGPRDWKEGGPPPNIPPPPPPPPLLLP